MTKTKTAGGTIERGTANQRHFVRALDNDDDHDARAVVSHGTGKVCVAITNRADERRVRELAGEWGAEIRLDWLLQDGDEGAKPLYVSGDVALIAEF